MGMSPSCGMHEIRMGYQGLTRNSALSHPAPCQGRQRQLLLLKIFLSSWTRLPIIGALGLGGD